MKGGEWPRQAENLRRGSVVPDREKEQCQALPGLIFI